MFVTPMPTGDPWAAQQQLVLSGKPQFFGVTVAEKRRQLDTDNWPLATRNCSMPSRKDVQQHIEALRDKIRYHEHRYYVLDDPEVSDAEFDRLMNQLKTLEAEHPELVTPDSPTRRVGGKPREGFVKVPHSSAMLSLDNAYTEDELREFDRRVRDLLDGQSFEYVAELKLDGLSMAARYRDGRIEQA